MSQPQKVLTAKCPNSKIFDHQIPDPQISDRQIPDRQISDRPLSPTGGVNPMWVSPLSWDRHLSCYPQFLTLHQITIGNLVITLHNPLEKITFSALGRENYFLYQWDDPVPF